MMTSHSKVNKIVKIADKDDKCPYLQGLEEMYQRLEECIVHFESANDNNQEVRVWFDMNTKEKRQHNEEPYNEEVAMRIFNEQYGRKAFKKSILKPFAWNIEREE